VKIAYQDLEYFRTLHDNWYDDRLIFPIAFQLIKYFDDAYAVPPKGKWR
jgi:hypothetical protein